MRLFAKPSIEISPKKSLATYPADEVKTVSPVKKRSLHIRTKNLKLSENTSGLFSQPFQVKKFWDGAVCIAYKENYVDGRPSPCDINEKLILRQEKKYASQSKNSLSASDCIESEAKYEGYSLEKSAEGQWRIKDHHNNTFINPDPLQTYIYVTMSSGTIRVSTRSKDGHLSLSGLARHVRYAGEVTFDENQQIKSWNNASYSYCPAPFLASQAQFGEVLCHFRPVIDRNSAQKQTRPIFSPR